MIAEPEHGSLKSTVAEDIGLFERKWNHRSRSLNPNVLQLNVEALGCPDISYLYQVLSACLICVSRDVSL